MKQKIRRTGWRPDGTREEFLIVDKWNVFHRLAYRRNDCHQRGPWGRVEISKKELARLIPARQAA